jgi:hypothetical protein
MVINQSFGHEQCYIEFGTDSETYSLQVIPCCRNHGQALCLLTYAPGEMMNIVRLEVSTTVTMKNGIFWDVTPCGSCKYRRFEET